MCIACCSIAWCATRGRMAAAVVHDSSNTIAATAVQALQPHRSTAAALATWHMVISIVAAPQQHHCSIMPHTRMIFCIVGNTLRMKSQVGNTLRQKPCSGRQPGITAQVGHQKNVFRSATWNRVGIMFRSPTWNICVWPSAQQIKTNGRTGRRFARVSVSRSACVSSRRHRRSFCWVGNVVSISGSRKPRLLED